MMKRFLLAAACIALLCGCQENNPEPVKTLDITGTWELSSVSTKASVGSETVSVYISFLAEGTFELYQKIGAGRYTYFSGTYFLNKEENLLYGEYEGGSAWGPYEAEQDGTTLKLSKKAGKEVDTYKKIDSIPASVTENTY